MIYVHDNPGNIPYNATLYVFMRQWYLPELHNHKFTKDSWLKVPALREETRDSVTYTCINSNFEYTAMMRVTDNGRLVGAARTKPDQPITQLQLDDIARVAFDIPQWERINQMAFPYHEMFDGKLTNARYQALNGTSRAAFFTHETSDPLFREIKKTVSPRPCNCGKGYQVR